MDVIHGEDVGSLDDCVLISNAGRKEVSLTSDSLDKVARCKPGTFCAPSLYFVFFDLPLLFLACEIVSGKLLFNTIDLHLNKVPLINS